MKHAVAARKELGVPTVFNILGPLANPAKPIAAAIGVARAELMPLMAQVLLDQGKEGFIFRGDDGLDEVSLSTTTTVIQIRIRNRNRANYGPCWRRCQIQRTDDPTNICRQIRANAGCSNFKCSLCDRSI